MVYQHTSLNPTAHGDIHIKSKIAIYSSNNSWNEWGALCAGNMLICIYLFIQHLTFFFSLRALSGFCVIANCIPQCQNGGMCLRPQLCVCKPGSNGKACEQKMVHTHSFPGLPGNGPTNRHTSGHTNGHNVVPQRPIPQQVSPNGYASAPAPSGNMGQMKLTVNPAPQLVRPHYIQQHIQQQ